MYEEDFRSINLLQAKQLVQYGHNDKFISSFFRVTLKTWNYWKKKYPSFGKMYEDWKSVGDVKVMRALIKRAEGFEYSREVKNEDGVVTDCNHQYFPPSDSSIQFYLTNRCPEEWKNSKSVNVDSNVNAKVALKVDRQEAQERLRDIVGAVTGLDKDTETEEILGDDLEDALR